MSATEATADDRIRGVLTRLSGPTLAVISREAGISYGKTRSAVRRMIAARQIIRRGYGRFVGYFLPGQSMEPQTVHLEGAAADGTR